jgi:phage/plasmid-associated DNA primase
MTDYQICKVPDYTKTYPKSNKINKPINVLSAMILQDMQFHERLFKDDMLKLAVDVDKLREYKPDYSFEQVLNDIMDYVKVSINDISYTTNSGVLSGSHHVVIPKYCMKGSRQKEYWMIFREKYGYGKEIDADIFDKDESGGWFRLPNQTGVVKKKIEGVWTVVSVKTPHIIQKGEIEDFVLKYVEKAEVYPFEATIKEEKTDKKKTIKKKIIKKTDKGETDTESINSDIIVDEEKNNLLKALIDCLKPDKADSYTEWINVGMILKNEGADESLFHYFSKKSSKYDEDDTTYKWNSFKSGILTIATLHYYARKDNMEMYADKIMNIKSVNLYKPLFTSGLIADYFKKLYGDYFIYCDGILYYFNGVYWKRDDKNNSNLNLFVNNDFFNNLMTYIFTHFRLNNDNKTIDEEERKNIHEDIRKFQGNVNTLRRGSVRKSFIEDIIIWITNNDIKFDENPYLFAFENKVFDLIKGDFTEPNPKDYISITVGYKYEDIDDLNSKKEFLMKWIDKILPNPEVRDFYLTILSTGLSGIQLQNFFIATGVGGNGKSVLDTLMLKMTGNYGYKIPNTVLLNPIKEGPNPQVYCIDKKRFLLATEPSDKHKICCSTIKELTGENSLNVRDNYSSKCGISLKMTLLMECNNLPLLDESTEAMLRRVIAVPFVSRFLSAERFEEFKDEPNTFLGDTYYTSDFFTDEYKQVLFMILTDYFKKVFKNNKIELGNTPEDCKKITMEYLAVSDNIFDWFNDVFEKADDSIMTFKEVFEIFKDGEFYGNLSKVDKRKYNQKYFYDKLEKNMFLKKFIKRRNDYFNNKQISSDSIVGWRFKAVEVKDLL